jgi:hypothetical protein
MKITEYFLGEGNSGTLALQKAMELRDKFLSSNFDKIGELDEETIHVSTCGANNYILVVIVIRLTYYPKKEQ